MIVRSVCILLCLPVLIAGCASLPANHCTTIGKKGEFCLLPPADLPEIQALNMFDIRSDRRQEIFIGQLQIDANAIRFAANTMFGTNLFSIIYDGKTLVSSPQHVNLHAERLVAMLELSIAPPTILENRLRDLRMQVYENNGNQARELFEHGNLIVHIEISNSTRGNMISIQLPLEHISIRITPLS